MLLGGWGAVRWAEAMPAPVRSFLPPASFVQLNIRGTPWLPFFPSVGDKNRREIFPNACSGRGSFFAVFLAEG